MNKEEKRHWIFGGSPPEVLSELPYESNGKCLCPYCDDKFGTAEEWHKHQVDKHKDKKYVGKPPWGLVSNE